MRKLFIAFILTSALSVTYLAQTTKSSDSPTVAQCLTEVQEYVGKQAAAARKAGQKPNYRAFQAQAKELAIKHAARFKTEKVLALELPILARLYIEADQPALARAAINRRLSNPKLSEAERAEALVTAVDIVMKGTPNDESIKLGEAYTAKVDALSSVVLKQKINAHNRMAAYYGYMDIDDKNLEHNQTILQLISQLAPAQRKEFEFAQASAYDRIALVQSNRGETEAALKTLQQGKAEMANAPRVQSMFDDGLNRYAFIGQPATPLKGAYWINAAPDQQQPDKQQIDVRGRVTLIQFTAHWCGPCRKSYPAMLKFHEQYKDRGLNVVMATQLYGYFDKRNDLKPEEEMAANREYYVEHHKLPLTIAVEPKLSFDNREDYERLRPTTNEGRYRVGGIPQIVLLNKQGIVHQILIGWDPANETRMAKLIEQLLQEPETKH